MLINLLRLFVDSINEFKQLTRYTKQRNFQRLWRYFKKKEINKLKGDQIKMILLSR